MVLNPSIPNVTVSDGDPNYLGGFTLVKNATVDTTIPGSIYIYTYTANMRFQMDPGNACVTFWSFDNSILVFDYNGMQLCMA